MNAILEFKHNITTAASVASTDYSKSVKVTFGQKLSNHFFTSRQEDPNYPTVLAVNDNPIITKVLKRIPTMEQKGLVFF